jgi:hypothetical protein
MSRKATTHKATSPKVTTAPPKGKVRSLRYKVTHLVSRTLGR